MITKEKAAKLGALALLAGTGAWEIAATLSVAARAPREGDWESAAREVRAGLAPGDAVAFAPRWIDPIGRLHLGDLLSSDDLGRMDAARYDRIWEVSIRGARAP